MTKSMPIKFCLVICLCYVAFVQRHSLALPLHIPVSKNVDGAAGGIPSLQKRFFYSTGYGPGGMNQGDEDDNEHDENGQESRRSYTVDEDESETTVEVEEHDDVVSDGGSLASDTGHPDPDAEISGRRLTKKDILKKLDHLRRKMIDYYLKNRHQGQSSVDPAIGSKINELYALIRGMRNFP